MIIPVRCFSCGLVLADKYRWYQSEVRRRKLEKKERLDKVIYLNSQNVGLITTEGEVLNDLWERGLHNILLESGPGLASTFMTEGLIDRISLYQNPSILGQGQDIFKNLEYKSLNHRSIMTDLETKWIGNDHYITGRPSCSPV